MIQRERHVEICVLLAWAAFSRSAQAQATDYTYVPLPANSSIETDLMSTFPTGMFTANNALATPFSIPTTPVTCGASGASPCNYYRFGLNATGTSITIQTSVASPTDVYTLMNAYDPASGQKLATITFVGSGGASLTFPLTGGQDIRDVHQSTYADTLSNGVQGVQALNAFSCVVPTNCTDESGLAPNGTYFIDEQHFSLGSTFAGQTLTQIILTDTFNGSEPILLGITVGTTQQPAPGTWTTGADMPMAVQGPATGVIGGMAYVVGGVTATATVNTNQIYNPQTDTWTMGAPIPTARDVPASAVVNGLLYVTGGKLNGVQLTVVEVYNPATDSWSTNYSQMPTARDSVVAVVSNGIIYVVGGFNNGSDRLNTVQSYDPATDTWTKETPLLVGKSSPAVGVLGSTLVAAGGLTNSGVTGDNEGYDFSTNSWQSLTPNPVARQAGCVATISGQLYFAGGKNNNGPVDTVQSFNLQENQWTTLAPMPQALANGGAAEVDNLLYCFGGAVTGTEVPNSTLTTQVFIYHPGAVSTPTISANGVASASAFGGFTSVAPGSWIEIYGANLAADTRVWGSSDFSGVNAPTSLDGTYVMIGGEPAFVDYISPGQVNAQVPSSVATGSQQLIVTTAAGASAAYSITVNAVEPGLLAPASFNVGGTQYVVALFSDNVTYALPQGATPGVSSRPAKPGDTLVLYGVGFGPVTPDIPAGQIVQQSNMLASSFQISIGGMPATLNYAGLAPNYVGLYQFNVVVPDIADNNAAPVTFSLGGQPGIQTLYIPVQN
jgi:uncharacterized protein (TIGR03437 family)